MFRHIFLIFFINSQLIQSESNYSYKQQKDYDCIFIYVSDDIVEYVLPYILRHEIIEYCVRPEPNDINNYNLYSSCYKHLDCDHVCLDWRQICDGTIDCINSGQDEENCFELEMNQCHSYDEYRCHNGMHCIPMDFLHDNALNPDCIDRSDETNPYFDYPANCSLDIAFRCDEHICRPSQTENIPCGNGQCTQNLFDRFCGNKREVLLEQILIEQLMTSQIHITCRRAMICVIEKSLEQCQETCSTKSSCNRLIQQYCPSIPFTFPSSAILFGHVYFVYDSQQIILNSKSILIPNYICFNRYLCNHFIHIHPFMSLTDEIICQNFKWPSIYSNWFQFVDDVRSKFQICSTIYVDSFHCQMNSTLLYHCQNSTKCISKHRLMDGIQDCILNDDENISYSCELDDQHFRFQCTNSVGKIDKCLSIITVHNQHFDCDKGNDEIDLGRELNQENIPFATLCDGFIDLIDPENNETDESHCFWWQCNNIYTRCNGVWNCQNGADELNCSYLPIKCPEMQHRCVSLHTSKTGCLPIEMAGNNHIDCIGGTDERYLCRSNGQVIFKPFACWNETKCLDIYDICDGEANCRYDDDEKFCTQNPSWVSEYVCMPSEDYEKTLEDRIICLVSLEQFHSFGQLKCLCPLAYYGYSCQYQNQRVSLTVQIRPELDWHTVFLLSIFLIDENQGIQSYDYIEYISIRDCLTKFDIYLLYSSRPKNNSKSYFVRIDVYDRILLTYRTSWLFPLKFSFLPVHRLSIQLTIPFLSSQIKSCSLKCEHGQCISFENHHLLHIKDFCLCDQGWSGRFCTIKHDKCQCSSNSICIGHGSFCLCPINRYGKDCLSNHLICQQNLCQHNGKCIGTDIRMLSSKSSPIRKFTCLCSEGYSDKTCQSLDPKISLRFQYDISIPAYILAHLITVVSNSIPNRITMFKKVPFDQNEVVLYISQKFHLLFIEFSSKYYLTIVEKEFKSFRNLSSEIVSSRRCRNINELFNSSILQLDLLRRVKLYHLSCEENRQLSCFYDENYMCLCDVNSHQANCFEFDHNMTYNCRGNRFCQNNAQCFQDDSSCPRTFICGCTECYYGRRCQLSTNGFELSLDAILGYQIRPSLSLLQQAFVVKFSLILVIVMVTLSLITNTLSILTFQIKKTRETSCGLYLLITSITSLLTMILFAIKFIIVLLTHMNIINNRILLNYLCISMDFILSNLLNSTDWLSSCVGIERFVIVIKGVDFDRKQNKKTAKLIIPIVILLCNLTILHDPIHRRLLDDFEENRIWCIVSYSSFLNIYNSTIHTFHFLAPLTINFLSTIFIVVIIAYRKQSFEKKTLGYRKYLWKQYGKYQHILLPPCFLVLLRIPRLIIVYLSGCMKSARDPWLFLAAYFISFLPPIFHFFVFVLPSREYRKQFRNVF
ncbi:unnamed protein product [Adineta ricciae]|uniref:Uncharacterized protein n=1 Tax=Adineta ricciae TaxID=249248 RepID=A0A815XY53_ADIRI|nr:unnamed protein product [Adineta ricciae]CAF1563245.1 unnamed protein product [Adineta ricciae]